ncbi:MAG: hypothetical protein R3C14_22090 [Caldilineaceae bacterium]
MFIHDKHCKLSRNFVRLFIVVIIWVGAALVTADQPSVVYAAPPGYTQLGGLVTNNYRTWQPTNSSWVSGNAAGYAEGDVVALSLQVNGATIGNNYYFTACFNYAATNGAYAFIDLKPYGSSFSPTLRGGAITSTLSGVAADGATINYVTPLTRNAAPCGNNNLGYEIGLTANTAGIFYIYYGAELARAGAVSELGDTIPTGKGVGAWPTGTFQTFLQNVTGNKTLNFSPSDIAVVITIQKLVDRDRDGVADLTGGTDNDPLLANYSFTVCDNNRSPGHSSCTTLTTDNSGKVTFTRPSDKRYDLFETNLATDYEFVMWGGNCTNSGGVNHKGDLTLAVTGATCTVLNQAVFVPNPALTIVKSATPQTYSAVNQVINYSYLVTNSGNVTLNGPFTVSDDKSTDESCPATATLAPSASITCTASYTISQADLDAGSVTNTASVSNGTVTSPTDSETVTAVVTKALTIAKSAMPQTYNAVNQVINYSYLVTNSGNVTLSGPFTVDDDKSTDESCPTTFTLLPGAFITCTASYTISQADLDAGSVTNKATARGGGATSNEATATVNAVQTITIVKQTSGGNGTFNFDTDSNLNTAEFSIATSASTGSATPFTTPAPGVYKVTELAQTGWDLERIVCTGDADQGSSINNASVAIDLDAGEQITCTFYNAKRGNITIVKQTVGGNGAFGFDTNANSAADFTINTSGGTGSNNTFFALVTSNTYTITELTQTGWDLTGLGCMGDGNNSTLNQTTGTVAVRLLPGANVTCTFTNTKRSKITVIKKTEGTDGAFGFSSSTLPSQHFTVTTSSNIGGQVFADLVPQLYDVSELAASGWQLTNIGCIGAVNSTIVIGNNNSAAFDAGDTDVAIDLKSGEEITCTFINDPLPQATVTKQANVTSLPEPGGAVVYTVDVTNTTAEQLTLTALTDVLNGGTPVDITAIAGNLINTTCVTPIDLAPTGQNGDSYSCQFTVNLQGEPKDYNDIVTATLADDEGNEITPTGEATVEITDVLPTATATKLATPSTLTEPGGTVTFHVTVINTSVVEELYLTDLIDNPYGDITQVGHDGIVATTCDVTPPQTLAANGGSYQCQFTIDFTNVAPGSYEDTITATLFDNEENRIQPTANAKVTVNDNPGSIMAAKIAKPASIPEPGGMVTFTFVVTNTSQVDDVTITEINDNVYGNVCGAPLSVVLAPGEAYRCNYPTSVTGNAGATHTNTVTVKGTDDDGKAVEDMASATVTITNLPSSLTVVKSANVSEVPEPGALVTFTVEIQNTSVTDSITLTDVVDSQFDLSGSSCQALIATILTPQQMVSCTFTGFVGGNAGFTHINLVTVAGVDDDNVPVRGSDQEEVLIDNVPSSIKVTKRANTNTIPEPGATVTFTIVVSNTSAVDNVALDSLNDDLVGPVTNCTPALGTLLAPGEAHLCTLTASIQGNAGFVHANTVTASGKDDDNNPVSDSDGETVTLTDVPSSLKVTKTANRTSVLEPGANVTFTIQVENTSLVDTVTITHVVDSQFGDISAKCLPPLAVALAPGEMVTCQVVEFISGAVGSTHINVATAYGRDDDGNALTANSDPVRVTILDVPSSLSVTKTATPSSLPEPGGVVTFTVVVENSSAVDSVTLDTATDNRFGDIRSFCAVNEWPVTLAPGVAITCTWTRTISGNAGFVHENTVTVSGKDDDGNAIAGSDSAVVTITDVAPAVTVTKAANPNTVPESGGAVTFSVVVVNNSAAEALSLTTLVDNIYGDLNGQGTCVVPQTLAKAGGEYRCSFTKMVTGDFGNNHVNEVTATARDDEGGTDQDQDSATVVFSDVKPQIEVSKASNLARVPEQGGDVNYTVTVVNNSLEAAQLTSLLDDRFGNLNGKGDCVVPQTLAADGGSYSCSFTMRISGTVSTPHVNVVTATAQDDDGNEDVDMAQATVGFFQVAPNLQVTKSYTHLTDADNNHKVSPGDTLRYEITVLNIGNGVASSTIFSDTPDANTTLVVGSVTTTKGTVTKGNTANDRTVAVEIGDIAPNSAETIRIVFDVVIKTGIKTPFIRNQGVVAIVTGQSEDTSEPSDDPSTPKVDDETITEVFIPTAEEETEEPTPPQKARVIYLPVIVR